MPADRDLRIEKLRAEISVLRNEARRLTTLVWLPTTEPERKKLAQAELEEAELRLKQLRERLKSKQQ